MPIDRVQVQRGYSLYLCLCTGEPRGSGEIHAEATEGIRVRTVEGPGADVGIAKKHDRHPARREFGQEGERGLGDLLGIVENQQAQPGQSAERRRPGWSGSGAAHHGRRKLGKFGGVELSRARLVFGLFIAGHKLGCGNPFRPAMGLTQRGQPRGRHSVFDRTHHEIAQFRSESAQATHVGAEAHGPVRTGAFLEVSLQKLGDNLVLLAPSEQCRVRAPGLRLRALHKLKGNRVGAAGQGPIGRNTEA